MSWFSKSSTENCSVLGVWAGVSGPDPFCRLTAISACPFPSGPLIRTNSTRLCPLNQLRDMRWAMRWVKLAWNMMCVIKILMRSSLFFYGLTTSLRQRWQVYTIADRLPVLEPTVWQCMWTTFVMRKKVEYLQPMKCLSVNVLMHLFCYHCTLLYNYPKTTRDNPGRCGSCLFCDAMCQY